MITLTQLEYILAVGRHKSFSLAAKACHVTQPTLSMQVRKLEDDLEVMLFDRSSHPVEPTVIGRKVLEQSALVISQAQRLRALIHEERETVQGQLRLAVIPTLAPYALPLFLQRFCASYPQVLVRVDEMKTDDIIARLRAGELDVGLLATPLHAPLIEEHPVFQEPFYIYASRGSPLCAIDEISDSDLKGENVLLLTEGHCLRTQVARVCGLRKGRRRSTATPFEFEGGSLETLCRLVEQGLGCTVIPHLARLHDTRRGGRVIPFRQPQPSRQVSLCVHASFARRGLLEALRQTIVRSLPPELRAPTAAFTTVGPT